MDGGLLVATQLSSLFSSSRETFRNIGTSRRNIPLPPAPKDSDTPVEHASYSYVFRSKETGTILLRVLHDRLTLELVSLTTDIPPIRFVFPAILLGNPGIFLWQSEQLHILAVTTVGSLYRLVLPVLEGGQCWVDQLSGNWCREHHIRSVVGQCEGLVQVQGAHCVAIALPNGDILRLETESMGDEENDDEWTETPFHHGSFFASLTSFLPVLQSGPSPGSQIVSTASYPQPTDVGHIWTLSRDRTLRLWTAKSGCVSAKTFSSTSQGRASTPLPDSSSSPTKHMTLLEPEPQNLLKVFPFHRDDDSPLVALFMPTPSSLTSGGFFYFCRTIGDQLIPLHRTIECPVTTAHCHLQDFLVTGRTLSTLWDRQGQSYVETVDYTITAAGEVAVDPRSWWSASYPRQAELTPAYLDELLLSTGSFVERCFAAIMRPGMFSTLTLRTAIDQYTAACQSLPGPLPPQLRTSYASLGENIAAVVGCTVNLTRDTQSGALQHTKYWNALKRDWEGFIARCREIERSARWPLALGIGDTGDVIVVERERIGALVGEDTALRIHRRLCHSLPLDPPYSLMETLWTLSSKLPTQFRVDLENRLTSVVQQEIAFLYAEVVQDQVLQSGFKGELDEGLESWISGRLQSVDDIDVAIRTVLDVIGEFEKEVKREEEEVEMLLPPSSSSWTRALVASYVSSSIDVRYELCISLVTLLFFLSDELGDWDPAMLAEIFAVFRGVSMLRYIARQPVGDVHAVGFVDNNAPDDVVNRMRNMRMASVGGPHVPPASSLIHQLLVQAGNAYRLPGAAHGFLDSTGLLDSDSPAHSTKLEVIFCERLRLLGYTEAARELLSWLPRTPGVTYVRARLWLDIGRSDDAALLFESLTGSFGRQLAISSQDAEALSSVLPGAALFDSEFSFYLHVAALFRAVHETSYEVKFTQLAISVASPDTDSSSLWSSVTKGYVDLAEYEDAYASIVATPPDMLNRDCISQLVYRMCEENAVAQIMSFNFIGFSDEVEDALSFKARNADPRVRPFYSRILHTWYTSRGDYRSAALTMYQRARKLADIPADSARFTELGEERLEAYSVALNALSLLDKKSAWLVMPVFTEAGHEPRKRRKLSKHIPEEKYALGKRDVEIIELADIRREYTLLAARLELARRDPSFLATGEFSSSAPSVVMRLAQTNQFSMAMATARSLDVDMSDLFARLTVQCLRLSQTPEIVIQEDTSDWLLTDKVSSWPGTPADKGWRYLRQSLQRHDCSETDYKYTKVVLETMLGYSRASHPPPWLVHTLEGGDDEFLVRTCLRYEMMELALEYSLSLLRKVELGLARNPPKGSLTTWLPYPLIDQVLTAAKAEDGSSVHTQSLRDALQLEVGNHVKRMQKLSHVS
ncbi:hypothetical protein JAAARDRAFT_167821 [Jaapia argillacea MUCL 33604]|uniref:Uncharacterized protein n=1 Tax=Jaapia argillacea MUCL 33604 TaxID=933084 RepID=A0A067QDI5_9AGAM|nr:hypothetical protein JAAARDRAFT_167821 [Jaapia argillacea MUCL 33604]